MKERSEDIFIEEVDQELRRINARLKKAFSEAEALLREHAGEAEQPAAGAPASKSEEEKEEEPRQGAQGTERST